MYLYGGLPYDPNYINFKIIFEMKFQNKGFGEKSQILMNMWVNHKGFEKQSVRSWHFRIYQTWNFTQLEHAEAEYPSARCLRSPCLSFVTWKVLYAEILPCLSGLLKILWGLCKCLFSILYGINQIQVVVAMIIFLCEILHVI